MLLLSRYDVSTVLDMPMAIEAMRVAFGSLSSSRLSMPTRLVAPVPPADGSVLLMPCFLPGDPDRLVVKTVTVFPHNARYGKPNILGHVTVYDPETGEPLCVMDAEFLTALRTGAASALATDFLARRDASVMLLYGAGQQAEYQIEGVCQVRSLDRVFVAGRSPDRAMTFAARMEEKFGFPVTYTPDAEAAVPLAHIICTATSSFEPLFDGSWIGPGTHINAIGAFRPEMREVDSLTVCASRVFVDHMESAMRGAGDLVIPVQQGEFDWSLVAGDLGELVLGQKAGRMSDKEVTLFKSVGVAIQDAILGGLAYDRARELHLGQEVEL